MRNWQAINAAADRRDWITVADLMASATHHRLSASARLQASAAVAPPTPRPTAPTYSDDADTARCQRIADRLHARLMDPQRTTHDGRMLSAVHEAGHGLMAHLASPRISCVQWLRVCAAGDYLGQTLYVFSPCEQVTPHEELLCLAAGAAAQRLYTVYQSRVSLKPHMAGYITFEGASGDMTAARALGFTDGDFDLAIDVAQRVLRDGDNFAAVLASANRLMQTGEVKGAEFENIVRPFVLTPVRLALRSA